MIVDKPWGKVATYSLNQPSSVRTQPSGTWASPMTRTGIPGGTWRRNSPSTVTGVRPVAVPRLTLPDPRRWASVMVVVRRSPAISSPSRLIRRRL